MCFFNQNVINFSEIYHRNHGESIASLLKDSLEKSTSKNPMIYCQQSLKFKNLVKCSSIFIFREKKEFVKLNFKFITQ